MNIWSSKIAAVLVAVALATGGAVGAERRAEAAEAHEHMDSRHGHDRVYVDRGVAFPAVPHGAVVVHDGPNRYWFHGGIW